MSDQTEPSAAEKAAAEALANQQADPAPADPPADAPAEEPAADPTVPEPTGNAISSEGSATAPSAEEEPGIPDLEDAKAAAHEQASEIASAAEENRPEPEAEPEPEEEPEDTVYVVYTAVQGMPYPGQFLTVEIRVEDAENGDPQYTSLTLEERVPTLVPASHASKLTELESDHYAIESA